VGTDDGLVQITRDDGRTWTNVTPKNWAPGWVYTIEPSQHDKGTVYVVISRHRTGDMTPHFYKTTDYGETWTDLAATLPQDAPARALREDPVRKGMLYAVTEYKMWISFDDGAHSRPFQQNLPHVPFSDILVHDSDLLVSTEGRGFWILDDITTLRQLSLDAAKSKVTLFKPRDTYRIPSGDESPQARNGISGADQSSQWRDHSLRLGGRAVGVRNSKTGYPRCQRRGGAWLHFGTAAKAETQCGSEKRCECCGSRETQCRSWRRSHANE
jgi:hypothetical protein